MSQTPLFEGIGKNKFSTQLSFLMLKASLQCGGSWYAKTHAGSETGLSGSPVLSILLTHSHPSYPQALSVWGRKCLFAPCRQCLCLNGVGHSCLGLG